MTIFCDKDMCIRDVGVNSKQDPNLTAYEVTDGTFDNWSNAKICCYKVNVSDGHITALTPYVDSRLIEHLDRLGNEVPKKFSKRAYIGDTEVRFPYVDGIVSSNIGEVEITDYEIIVHFDELQEVATVTISII